MRETVYRVNIITNRIRGIVNAFCAESKINAKP